MKSREELDRELANTIAAKLEKKVKETGEASLLVSGGSTPVKLFQLLSKYEIAWNKVKVSLVDERFVTKGHKDSNELLVRENLLKAHAKNAQFIPLLIDETNAKLNITAARTLVKNIAQPFTVVVLGMGIDGHTASLFPQSPQLQEGMDINTKEVLLLTDPVTAPYKRISFTRKALLNADNLFLHCFGEEKKRVLNEAQKEEKWNKYPISGFIHHDKLKIFWSK